MDKLIALHELLLKMNLDVENLTIEQSIELLRVLKDTHKEITN